MEHLNTLDPYFYLLMRTDLASMNPGKAAAHGAHAGSLFTHDMGNLAGRETNASELRLLNMFNQWEASARGFGVAITLAVNGRTLDQVVNFMKMHPDAAANMVHDPSYPVTDGDVTHLIPLNTCGYVFGHKPDLRPLLGQFGLMA